MIAALAQQPQSTNAAWWVPFLIPLGALLGAIVTGSITWQSSRKKPHEKLQHLVEVLNDWPKVGDEDLPGKDTVQIAIALTLGEMRRNEKLDLFGMPREWAGQTDPDMVDFYEHMVDIEIGGRAFRSRLAEFTFNAMLLTGLIGAAVFMMRSNSVFQVAREHPVLTASALTVLIVVLSALRTTIFSAAWIPNRLKEEMRERVRQWVLARSPWRAQFDRERKFGASPGDAGETPNRDADATEPHRQTAPAQPRNTPDSSPTQPAAHAPPQT